MKNTKILDWNWDQNCLGTTALDDRCKTGGKYWKQNLKKVKASSTPVNVSSELDMYPLTSLSQTCYSYNRKTNVFWIKDIILPCGDMKFLFECWNIFQHQFIGVKTIMTDKLHGKGRKRSRGMPPLFWNGCCSSHSINFLFNNLQCHLRAKCSKNIVNYTTRYALTGKSYFKQIHVHDSKET